MSCFSSKVQFFVSIIFIGKTSEIVRDKKKNRKLPVGREKIENKK
jgi:hypothetical protein